MSNNSLFGADKINVNKSLLKSQAYELIKTAIVNNRIKPDIIYSQGFLSEQLGISRTPVREALLQLQGEGVIRIFRGRGIQVITASHKDLKDLSELCDAIGCKACQLAAARIDNKTLARLAKIYKQQEEVAAHGKITEFIQKSREFHLIIAQATGNKKFVESIEGIQEQLMRSGYLICSADYLPDMTREHKQILDMLNTRSEQKSMEAMSEHIKGAFSRAMASSAI